MPFDLKSLKESLFVIEELATKENKILIGDLGIPKCFDHRLHDLYLPTHMKDLFKQEIPSFVKFSHVVGVGEMFMVEKGFPYDNYRKYLDEQP